jgi:hypothetical protein
MLALLKGAAYSQHVVAKSLINVEEQFDRIVGKRTGTPDGLSTTTSHKAESIAWRKAFGGVRVPRGVYRFKTHDEADQWLWRMIARPSS